MKIRPGVLAAPLAADDGKSRWIGRLGLADSDIESIPEAFVHG
jgi:hypothetical protein